MFDVLMLLQARKKPGQRSEGGLYRQNERSKSLWCMTIITTFHCHVPSFTIRRTLHTQPN